MLKRLFLLLLACLILLPATGYAQKRRKRSPARNTKPAAAKTTPNMEVTAGAERVAEQVKVLSKFLYLYGSVWKGIETADAAASRGQASQSVLEQTQRNKATVRDSIANVREQLDELEIDFRTKPELQPYYTQLAGVASGAVSAENEAAAGQYDRAGRSLLEVVNRLTDVLLAMR